MYRIDMTTQQVINLTKQNRFIGYGHKSEQCPFCTEIIHTTTIKFRLLDGKTIREQDLSDQTKGFSKARPFIAHISKKHNKQYIENLREILKR